MLAEPLGHLRRGVRVLSLQWPAIATYDWCRSAPTPRPLITPMSESQSQVATRISDERPLRVGTGRSTSTTEVGVRALDAHAFRELAGAEQAVASGNRQRSQFDPTAVTAQAAV